jgi:hypothetical protein
VKARTKGVGLTVQSLHVEPAETNCRNRQQEIEVSKIFDSLQSGGNERIESCRRKDLLFRSLSSRLELGLLTFARIGFVTSFPVILFPSVVVGDGRRGLEPL